MNTKSCAKLKYNSDVNSLLVYVYLDHKEAKHVRLSRNYHCRVIYGGNQCRVISAGNINYFSCCKFSSVCEFAFGS